MLLPRKNNNNHNNHNHPVPNHAALHTGKDLSFQSFCQNVMFFSYRRTFRVQLFHVGEFVFDNDEGPFPTSQETMLFLLSITVQN